MKVTVIHSQDLTDSDCEMKKIFSIPHSVNGILWQKVTMLLWLSFRQMKDSAER
jgi:hypothetical protein